MSMHTYNGMYECGIGVGSLLWISPWILLMPLLPEVWPDWSVVLLWRLVMSPFPACPLAAGWNGVDVACPARFPAKRVLLSPTCYNNNCYQVIIVISSMWIIKRLHIFEQRVKSEKKISFMWKIIETKLNISGLQISFPLTKL